LLIALQILTKPQRRDAIIGTEPLSYRREKTEKFTLRKVPGNSGSFPKLFLELKIFHVGRIRSLIIKESVEET
jgi:hypothetical protein